MQPKHAVSIGHKMHLKALCQPGKRRKCSVKMWWSSHQNTKSNIVGDNIFLVLKLQRKLSCGQCRRPSPDWLWSFPSEPPHRGKWPHESTGFFSSWSCNVTGNAWFLATVTYFLVQETRGQVSSCTWHLNLWCRSHGFLKVGVPGDTAGSTEAWQLLFGKGIWPSFSQDRQNPSAANRACLLWGRGSPKESTSLSMGGFAENSLF